MPNLLFCELLPVFLFGSDNLQDVSPVGMLHNNAETVGRVFKKCLFVSNNVRMVDAGEDANLVECIFFFFATEFLHFYFFHGVNCVVGLANHLINFAERSFT